MKNQALVSLENAANIEELIKKVAEYALQNKKLKKWCKYCEEVALFWGKYLFFA